MRTAIHSRLAACGLLALLAVACGGGEGGAAEGPAAAGPVAAGPLTLVDLDGRPVQPLTTAAAGTEVENEVGAGSEAGGGRTATVFFFVGTECPISNRYAPELRRLAADYGDRGVAFWLVYPDDDGPEAIRRHRAEFELPMPALRDPDHRLVERAGAEVTPEAAVFSAGGELLYGGRIDDWYVDFGRPRAAPTRRDLRRALDAVLAGRRPPNRRRRAVGCAIPSPRPVLREDRPA